MYHRQIMMSEIKAYIPKYIQFIFLSLLLLIIINLGFRFTLFFMNNELANSASNSDILHSLFNIGLLFDLYISLIILLLPYAISAIPFLFNKNSKYFLLIGNWIIIILAIINISVSSTDLGYFRYYNSRITNAIFDWTNDISLMLKVMSNDSTYLPYFIAFIVVAGLYIYIQIKILKGVVSQSPKQLNLKYRLAIFIGSTVLVFFGIRGSLNFRHTPLKFNDAYFSENLFLNQLSFNPVYYLAYSYRNTKVNYFSNDEEIINTALGYLNRQKSNTANPFEIQLNGNDQWKPNIIFVLLESMSNAMVSRYNPGYRTTPFLDSLAEQGVVFDNFFSAGIHTHNGIFSSFYGWPANMHNAPMNTLATASLKFHGLPWILKEKDYQNLFYVTGAKQFDNMNNFLIVNGFDKVIGESDYPADSVYNGWGVTDKTMFNRVLNDCDSLYSSNKNFFASVLTISAHEGYVVPASYDEELINKEHPYKLYEFSDIVLKEFMNSAETREWYDNTVFVFVGDHGQNFSPVYDMNLTYHQVPLIIYSPENIDHFAYKDFGLQQDIYPTLFGLLGFNYVNNALGVDLFKHKRQFAFFSSDTKLGVLDDEHFLIYREKNNISMYSYKSNSVRDIYFENPTKADSMLSYGFSMIQSAKFVIDNELTSINGAAKPPE